MLGWQGMNLVEYDMLVEVTTRKEAIHMSASVYTRYAYVGGGYVTIITVDGK
jgi:hypothetical protein